MLKHGFILFSAFLVLLAPGPSAPAQELTFENLEFEYLHNADLTKSDLVEKVVLIHFWGTT